MRTGSHCSYRQKLRISKSKKRSWELLPPGIQSERREQLSKVFSEWLTKNPGGSQAGKKCSDTMRKKLSITTKKWRHTHRNEALHSLNGKWSRRFAYCVVCKTRSYRHHAKGYCTSCLANKRRKVVPMLAMSREVMRTLEG
jgi:hypothetical protein